MACRAAFMAAADACLDEAFKHDHDRVPTYMWPQIFAPITFVSSLLGVTIVGYLVRKSGRASIIILLMVSTLRSSQTTGNKVMK